MNPLTAPGPTCSTSSPMPWWDTIVARSTKRSLRVRWWYDLICLNNRCFRLLIVSVGRIERFAWYHCHWALSDPSLVISVIQAYRFIILKNKVVLAQFQNSAPQYLTLAEGFWKALSSLPVTYDYSAYRQLFQTYGTHYLSEGSLGGEYQALLKLDRQALLSTSKDFWCDYCCYWYFSLYIACT